MGKKPREDKLRRMVACEAARIMAEQGDDDFGRARNKAAARLQLTKRHLLPDNDEIARALEEHLQLYGGERLQDRLQEMRETALQAMERFGDFQPRLVGPVFEGTANEYSPVQIHLFADYPEQLSMQLHDMRIRFEESERNQRFADGTNRRCPLFTFIAGDHAIELICLSRLEIRNPPLNPRDNRPNRGASLSQVETLIGECSF